MATDRLLDLVGRPGGPLADAALWHLQVTESASLTPSIHRVVLTAPGIEGLQYAPGQDLMLRIPLVGDKIVNRRYTIRRFDQAGKTVTIDVSLHGAGPGTDWIRAAEVGDRIDAIGPRGKVTVNPEADWHLFVVDETGLPGALAMIEALPSGSRATAIAEVDTPADEQEPAAHRGSCSAYGGSTASAHQSPATQPGFWKRSHRWTFPPGSDTPTWPPRPGSSGRPSRS